MADYEVTSDTVEIDYTNWRGERRTRAIIPLSLDFASNQWHAEPQWLLLAIDMETTGEKTFAMKDIHSWRKAPST